MKIHPVRTSWFYADERMDKWTDKHDEANSRFS